VAQFKMKCGVVCEGLEGIQLAHDRVQRQNCEHGNLTSSSWDSAGSEQSPVAGSFGHGNETLYSMNVAMLF